MHKKNRRPASPVGDLGRRGVLAGLGGLALGALLPARPARAAVHNAIRIGFTPAFVRGQQALLEDWRRHMEHRLGLRVEIRQRDSYREIMELLRLRQLDFAWVSDYLFLALKDLVRLTAVPLYQGRPMYRSYIIVPADNQRATGIADLQGTVFAYADPLSNTGYLYPRYAIHQFGKDPQHYFRKTFFTWSHKKVVEAVARGVAQGGAVDSHVWESLARFDPALTQGTRVVERSLEYGFPPFVAHRDVSPEQFAQLRDCLVTLHQDPEGVALLGRLNLDGFIKGDVRLYDGVARMMRVFGED